MLKSLSILALAAAFVAPVAHADQINGTIQASGSDTITNNSITFGAATVGGQSTGDFSSVLNGTPVSFAPGALPYSLGENTTPGGSRMLFTVTAGGETFQFNIMSYTASETGSGTGAETLTVLGSGTFVGSGAIVYDPTPGNFLFTTQLVNGQTTNSTFSASANALPSAVPEPSTLMLLGTGVFGAAGVIRRRMMGASAK